MQANLVPACVQAFFAVALTGSLCVALPDEELLKQHDASVTAYLAGTTSEQNVQPLHLQRGAFMDGTRRASGFFGWMVNAQPFGEAFNGHVSMNGLSLVTGAYDAAAVDLTLPAKQPWVIGRSYNAVQNDGSHHDSNGYQGVNWFQSSQPELVFYDDVSSSDDDMVYLVYGADRFIAFRRLITDTEPDPDEFDDFKWRAVNGAGGVLEHEEGTGGEPDTWSYYDNVGNTAVFFGDNTASSKADWQLWKLIAIDGSEAFIGDNTTASTAVSSGYNADGSVSVAYDSSDRRYSYSYTTLDSFSRLTEVVCETKTGGTWASPTGLSEVGSVDYEYYQTGDNTYGTNGDLQLVVQTMPLTDSGVSIERKTYYRYWKGSYDDTTNPGHQHGLQYIVTAEGTRRLDWLDSTFDEDFKSANETILKPYTAAYFEYNADHQVDKAWFNGECGCSGANNGVYEFAYTTVGSDAAGYENESRYVTTIDQPDGMFQRKLFDETGQPLSRVMQDVDFVDGSETVQWVWHNTRATTGVVAKRFDPGQYNYTYSGGSGAYSIAVDLSAPVHESAAATSSTGQTEGIPTHQQEQIGAGTPFYLVERHFDSRVLSRAGFGPDELPFVDSTYRPTTQATSLHGTSTDFNETAWTSGLGSGDDWKVVNTDPAITTATNGAGTGTRGETSAYIADGRYTTFTKNRDGVISYRVYNSNGQVVTAVSDADTTKTAGGEIFNGVTIPSGFASAGTPFHHKSSYTYDAQGRRETATQPDGRVTQSYWSKLADGRMVSISIPRVVSGTTFHGPASFSVTNHSGNAEVSGTLSIDGGSTTTALTSWIDETKDDPIEAVLSSVGELKALGVTIYDEAGSQVTESRAYFDLPTALPGTEGTHYDASFFVYDDMGRRIRSEDATGTVSRVEYDDLGRAIKSHVGTNDNGLTGGDTSGTNDMTQISLTEYDNGNDAGSSLVTKTTVDADGNWGTTSDQRVTEYLYDDRDRRVVTKTPEGPHSVVKYDNRGRVTASASYADGTSLTASTNPETSTTGRLSLSKTLYDNLNRAYRSEAYKINQSTGAIVQESSNDIMLVSESWFDIAGRNIKSVGSSITKTFYDRLGRATHSFVLATINDSGYSDADDVSGDVVLSESQTKYDETEGHVLARATIERLYDDIGGGATTGALDSNADADDLLWTKANIEGRIQITSMWYDDLDRLTDTVFYGDYGFDEGANTTFDRDGLSVPARSDTVLRSTTTFNDDGTVLETTDPKGLKSRTLYDDGLRPIASIANYVNGTPSSATGDDDVYTRMVYTDGLQTKLWVDLDGDNVEDADDQVTVYFYGVTKGVSAGDSQLASGRLLGEVEYPDSASATDVASYAYNALGQQIWTEDQAGNIIETDYDNAGRMLHRRVTTLDSDFDGDIRRVTTSYDDRGMVTEVQQWDNASAGSGTMQDEVEYVYNEWGQLTEFNQDHDGAYTGAGNGWSVEHDYDEALSTGTGAEYRTLRRTGMTYPDGSTLSYTYLSSGGLYDDDANRVTRVTRSSVVIAEYEYNGMGSLVGTELPEPEVWNNRYDHAGSAGNMGFVDRFGRVTHDVWTKGIDTTDPADGTYDEFLNYYEIELGYDRNSNITLIEDTRYDDPSGSDYVNRWDAQYTMDDLNRLTEVERGEYASSSFSSTDFNQLWTLGQTGNWELHQLDLNGDADFVDTNELDDDQTFNVVNELTARDTDDNGSDNFTLLYDEVGNLTDDGQHHEYVYDAFGRLRKVKNQSSVQTTEYRYNGLGHRITWHYDVDADGTLESTSDDPVYHFVHDERWRPLETYRDTHSSIDSDPKERFDYHAAGLGGSGSSSYIDRVILRDRDHNSGWASAADGTLEERLYLLQNWRADVIAIILPNGGPQMYYRYDAYGVPFAINAGDVNGDGSVDSLDFDEMLTMSGFDQRGDFADDYGNPGPDGQVSYGDFNWLLGEIGSYGRGHYEDESQAFGGLRKLYAGYELDPYLSGTKYHVRNRVYDAAQGRWSRRDPLGYVDGMGLYEYVGGRAVIATDPMGLAHAIGGGSGAINECATAGIGGAVSNKASRDGCGRDGRNDRPVDGGEDGRSFIGVNACERNNYKRILRGRAPTPAGTCENTLKASLKSCCKLPEFSVQYTVCVRKADRAYQECAGFTAPGITPAQSDCMGVCAAVWAEYNAQCASCGSTAQKILCGHAMEGLLIDCQAGCGADDPSPGPGNTMELTAKLVIAACQHVASE